MDRMRDRRVDGARPARPPAPKGPAGRGVLNLQRSAGNRAVGSLLASQRALQRSPQTADAPARTAAPAIDESQFVAWAVDAIDRYEDSCTRGLDDFEKSFPEKHGGVDWGLFAATVIGSLVWALACFETGGAAFFISLAGIGVGTAAAAEMAEATADGFDKSRFHAVTRKLVSGKGGIKEQLLALVAERAKTIAAESASHGWDATTAQAELLKRMFGPQFITSEAGIPKVNKWAVEKQVEANLLFQASSATPYAKDQGIEAGYEDGVWLAIDAEAPDAMEPGGRYTKPVTHWDVHMKKATIWDRTGDFPQMAERLNEIYGQDLGQPMTLLDWPLRKSLFVSPAGYDFDRLKPSIEIVLDEKSGIVAWRAWDLNQTDYHTSLEWTRSPNSDFESGRRPWISEDLIRALVMRLNLRAKRVHEIVEPPHRGRARMGDSSFQKP